MTAKKSLGRGFDVLIPKEVDASILEEDKNRVQHILISDIRPNPDQPRREFDQASLDELSTSIKRHGVLQPIILVRHRKGPGYEIVAGERRYRAAKSAKLDQIPAIVRSLEELEQIELSLIENIQRVDLSPLEQALSVYRLQQQFNLALDDIANKLGKAPSTVSNLSRLLQLPDDAKEALRTGKISEGHARAILALKDNPSQQEELLRSIINNKLSVRETEKQVLNYKQRVKNIDQIKSGLTQAEVKSMSQNIAKTLSAKVRITPKNKGGQIVIQYEDKDQLQSIVQQLSE